MIVGAHPDDAELGCGGAVAEWVQRGITVDFVVATLDSPNGWERSAEQHAAASLLGVNFVHGLRLPDGAVSETEVFRNVARLVQDWEPAYVITHHPEDSHRDHRAVAEGVRAVCRRGPSLLWMESPSSRGFQPNFYVPFDEEALEKAREAILAHASQGLPVDAYEGRVRYRGAQVGVPWAEGLAAERFIDTREGL